MTTVVTGVDFSKVVQIPNYKLITKIEIGFENPGTAGTYNNWHIEFSDSNGYNWTGGTYFGIDNLKNKTYTIEYNNGVPKEYLLIVKQEQQSLSSLSSITFYYRNPNVTITNKLPDGYTIDKESGTALLNSSYEFTVTWNPEEYRTPTVKANGKKLQSRTIDEATGTATYEIKIIEDTEIQINGGKLFVGGNTLIVDDFKWNQEYDISNYFYVNNSGSRIPSQIIVHANGDTYYSVALRGTCKYQYGNQYDGELWSRNTNYECTKEVQESGINYIYKINISGLELFENAKLCFYQGSQDVEIDYITFVYDNMVQTVQRSNAINAYLPAVVETDTTTTTTTTAPQTTTTTTTTTTTPPIAASENGKNVGLDESSAAGCNITFSAPLFNDSGVCYFTITPKAGYTLSDSYTVKVGTEVLSAKNNYNAKTGQWFFWSNKIMTDYTIHVEGVSPAA